MMDRWVAVLGILLSTGIILASLSSVAAHNKIKDLESKIEYLQEESTDFEKRIQHLETRHDR